jgi:hypothetical protein
LVTTSTPFEVTGITLLWIGPVTIAASAGAVWLVQRGALMFAQLFPSALSGPNARQIEQLQQSREPVIVAAVLVLVAVVVFAVICREAGNPVRTFRRVALWALLVSFVPDVLAGLASLFGWPLAIVYAAMHIVVWAVCVAILTRLTTCPSPVS